MKTALDEIIRKINSQTDELARARHAYLDKKAEKRNKEATLKKSAPGDSQAERSMNADATNDWLEFEKTLNRFEAIYEFQRDKLEALNKEYQAQYLELKDGSASIRKEGA